MIMTTKPEIILIILQTLVIYDLIKIFVALTFAVIRQFTKGASDANK